MVVFVNGWWPSLWSGIINTVMVRCTLLLHSKETSKWHFQYIFSSVLRPVANYRCLSFLMHSLLIELFHRYKKLIYIIINNTLSFLYFAYISLSLTGVYILWIKSYTAKKNKPKQNPLCSKACNTIKLLYFIDKMLPTNLMASLPMFRILS